MTPAPADAAIKPATLVKEAAEVYRAEVLGSDHLSASTRKTYAVALDRHIIGGNLAHLTVRDVKVSSVERALTEVANTSGASMSKTTRSVLRAVLNLAVKHDAIPFNPVRSAGPVHAPQGVHQGDGPRVHPPGAGCRARVRRHRPAAQRRDLPGLIAFLAGTGARLGEACGVPWSDLDLSEGTAKLGSASLAKG